jgi:hypothetical protein
MSKEPTNVYKKNIYAALIFLSRKPQIPTTRNIGINKISNII